MVNIECHKCNYRWDYKGKGEYWISCPRCRTNINIKKLEEVKEDGDDEE